MSDMNPASIVYFDGSCPLCRSEIELYRRQDQCGALQMIDISQPDSPVPPGIDRIEALRRFHVQSRDGEVRTGAAAFAEIWLQLPRWRWLGFVAASPPGVLVLELAYRLFLKVRPYVVRRMNASMTQSRIPTPHHQSDPGA